MIYVWDQTVLTRYFLDESTVLTQQWVNADRGRVGLIWPAAAISAANWEIGATWNSWHPLLIGETVTCPALTDATAIDAGRLHPDVVIGHVVYEATAVQGLIVSTDPSRYAGLGVPVLPI